MQPHAYERRIIGSNYRTRSEIPMQSHAYIKGDRYYMETLVFQIG